MSDLPKALVLMKFNGDPWNDKTYRVISEVLEEAGYEPIRADQIRTAGPVVEEVTTLMKSADLVVVDSSNDSHSVSYEVGYLHGVDREVSSIIHLRSESSGKIPFNFSHYRAHIYGNLKHLRRILRERLELGIPLANTQLGHSIGFGVPTSAGIYGDVAAQAILNGLKTMKFSGRCEFYCGDLLLLGELPLYIVCLACRFSGVKGELPDHHWWKRLDREVYKALQGNREHIEPRENSCEFGSVEYIKMSYPHNVTVHFENGTPTRILNIAKADSWLVSEVRKIISKADK